MNRGPIGTKNNTPLASNSSRHARTASSNLQCVSPALNNVFDVKQLLPVMTAQGWAVGRDFMAFWINGNACVSLVEDGKSSIGSNLANPGMRIFTMDWAWLTGVSPGFDVAKEGYQTLLKTKAFNNPAKNLIAKTYGETDGEFGAKLNDNMAPEQFFPLIKEHQLQYYGVESDTSGPVNDLTAALANFSFYAMYKGETILKKDFEKRIDDIFSNYKSLKSNIPNTHSSIFSVSSKGELLAACQTHLKSIVLVSHVAIYAGDVYEFNGWQYLGSWDIQNKTVIKSNLDALDTISFYFARPGLSGGDVFSSNRYVYVENETFRKYRDATCMGGDFLAFTPMSLEGVTQLIPVF